MTLNASGSYRPSLAVWGSQEEEGVDNFKSCVSATKRKYSNNNNMNSNNMSSKDKLHLHMLNERKQKRQITNGNSKTQATETSQSCALNFLVILVVVAVRDAQGPLETCFYTAHTHTHAHIDVQQTCISVYGYRLLFFIPDRRHRSCSDVAAMLLLLLRINYGNFWTLRTTHVRVAVCVRSVRGCAQQTTRAKEEFEHPQR